MMKIRYKYIKNTVNSLFIKLNITSYPIDILIIFSYFKNCRVISYSKHMKKYNLSSEEVIEYFGSDEGCTIYNTKQDKYLIFYNDLNIHYKTRERRRWTLAHELGHILLNHLKLTNKTKIFRNNLTDEEYEWLEVEANRFASLFLANPIILNELQIEGNTDIMKICKISEEASKNRFNDYLKWAKYKYMNSTDFKVIKLFHDFLYKKQCSICGNKFISEHAKYCPICGNNLTWGDGKVIYNDGYKLDENGKVFICPKCGNEQMFKDGCYCRICNTYLINKCSNDNGYERGYEDWAGPCGQIADGNARFCEYCGATTTFYNQKLLKDWQEAKAEIERAEMETAVAAEEVNDTNNYDDYNDIPF